MAKNKQQKKAKQPIKKAKQVKHKKAKTTNNSPAFWQKPWVIAVGISLLTFIIFLPALQNNFTNWDDVQYVTDNEMITSFSSENIHSMATKPVASNYHPLTMFTYALNYAVVGKDSAFFYILTNVVLHCLNTFLVFFFIFLLTNRTRIEVAIICALFFGIHPMHVESVAWISERKDVLYTFFFMLSSIAFLKYLVPSNTKREQITWYSITFLCFLLSLLSKPVAVVLPVVLLLIDFWKKRSLSWKLVVEKIPFFVGAIAFGLLAISTQSGTAIEDLETHTFLQKIMFASYGSMMYLVRFFFPFKLAAFYPFPIVSEGLSLEYQIAPFVVLLFLALTLISLKFTRNVVFGVGFFFVTIALVLQFIKVGAAIMADRYSYVPYIGLLFIIGMGFSCIWRSKHPKNTPLFKYGLVGLLAVYTLAFSYQSFGQIKIWKNSNTLWTQVIERYPLAKKAYNNRGEYYYDKKEFDKSLADYNVLLQLDKGYSSAYNNRGLIFYEKKQYAKALKDYNKAIALDKKYEEAYHNRGNANYSSNKYTEALADYNKSISLNPKNHRAYNNRANIYFMRGDYQEAIKNYTKTLTFDANHLQANLNRGITYYQLKEYKTALVDFNKAIQLNPKNGDPYLYISYIYNETGDNKNALTFAQKAKQLGKNVRADYLQGLQ